VSVARREREIEAISASSKDERTRTAIAERMRQRATKLSFLGMTDGTPLSEKFLRE
jgi:hypothetical protein